MFVSRCQFLLAEHGVVSFLGFGRRNVANMLRQPSIVEPNHSFQRGELDRLKTPLRSAPVDDLCFVEVINRLCQCIVIAVANAADGRLDASLR